MAAFDTANTIFTDSSDAAEYVIAGIRNNNEINDARFADWNDAETAFDVYIDGHNAGLDKSVDRDEVIAIVQPWLDKRQAFEAALASGPAFVAWAEGRDISRDELNRIIAETTHNSVVESAADVDYIAALENGDFLMWGADREDGRDLIVGVQGKNATSNLAVIFVPRWSADA